VHLQWIVRQFERCRRHRRLSNHHGSINLSSSWDQDHHFFY
jgi:hypothetical protein